MFEIMLFLHLAGLVLWFGASLSIACVIYFSRKQSLSSDTKVLIRKVIRMFGWLAQPSSILILISGIFMLVDMNLGDANRPLWLSYMEKGGGTIILLAVVVTAYMGRKIVKRLGAVNSTSSTAAIGGNLYLTSLTIILAATLSVILVVSLRLS